VIVGIGAAIVWVIGVQLIAATLTGIFQTALYRFATAGSAPGFDNDALRSAFRPRRTNGGFGGGLFGPGGFSGGGMGGPAA
jgi:hypothetical protein